MRGRAYGNCGYHMAYCFAYAGCNYFSTFFRRTRHAPPRTSMQERQLSPGLTDFLQYSINRGAVRSTLIGMEMQNESRHRSRWCCLHVREKWKPQASLGAQDDDHERSGRNRTLRSLQASIGTERILAPVSTSFRDVAVLTLINIC
uniref:Uncharacterized protein n=1 Tax=Anopheles farauti TaxID=69004 RepID=A0A182Q9S8_9DIPT